MTNETSNTPYAARLEIEYADRYDRLSTLLRLLFIIPIAIILALLSGGGGEDAIAFGRDGQTTEVTIGTAGVAGGLFLATLLMILFRQRYPRWWFDFGRELTRFSTRVGAYLVLVTDEYPSTEDEQRVHLELDYPDVERDLNRWLPLVKWLLAIPHYVVLFFLVIGAVFAVIIGWFAILFTGSYPRGLFDYVVGVGRWALRVQAYAFLLLTDEYPPFRLRA